MLWCITRITHSGTFPHMINKLRVTRYNRASLFMKKNALKAVTNANRPIRNTLEKIIHSFFFGMEGGGGFTIMMMIIISPVWSRSKPLKKFSSGCIGFSALLIGYSE